MTTSENNTTVLQRSGVCAPEDVYTESALCMGPDPRRNHSRGEARLATSSGPRVEEKTQSLMSEKAQVAGSGAGVAVRARSSLPGWKD